MYCCGYTRKRIVELARLRVGCKNRLKEMKEIPVTVERFTVCMLTVEGHKEDRLIKGNVVCCVLSGKVRGGTRTE